MIASKKTSVELPVFKIDLGLRDDIREINTSENRVYVVLDDDPTGTQTVADVPVLTSWSNNEIIAEVKRGTPFFFVMTNSRGLHHGKAASINFDIGQQIRKAQQLIGRPITVISRGDSTLRGHYPLETDYLAAGLESKEHINIFIPAFFEGYRYTADDIHYCIDQGKLVEVATTQFARDRTFGYKSSDLKDWIVEKSGSKISPDIIHSISVETLKYKMSEVILGTFKKMDPQDYLIVNATNYEHLDYFTLALLKSKKPFLMRSAASFVASVKGERTSEYLSPDKLTNSHGKGGLIVVGSYVKKTTHQLITFLNKEDIKSIRLDVTRILSSNASLYFSEVSRILGDYLKSDHDVVIYTSRDVKTARGKYESLNIGNRVSSFIVDLVSTVEEMPRFILTKGGITSSDIATKSLKIRRAIVKGQALQGIPVWETAKESKFPGMPFIIFPGNVGDHSTLLQCYQKLK